MSTVDGPSGPKINAPVVANEITKTASTEKATAESPTVAHKPVDVVEARSADRIWGDNRPASTPPPAPPADSKAASDTDTEVYSENLNLGLNHTKTTDGGSLRSLANDALAAAFMWSSTAPTRSGRNPDPTNSIFMWRDLAKSIALRRLSLQPYESSNYTVPDLEMYSHDFFSCAPERAL